MITSRRTFLLTASAAPAILKARFRRPNVLFIVSDDLNTALGCYGNSVVKSPYLDRLAARSVLFERAYCQFPLCAPSRASFLSGRRPARTGVWTLSIPTRKYMEDVVMLPELFRKSGYQTVNFGKVFHGTAPHLDPRSWDISEPGVSDKESWRAHIVEGHAMPKPRNHSMEWARVDLSDDAIGDADVAKRTIEYLRGSNRGEKPFFLGVGFHRPHAPYVAPSRYFDLYSTETIPLPRIPEGHVESILPAAWYELADQVPLTPEQTRAYIAAYYACVSFMDAQVGRILAALDECHLAENTVIVLFGDQGYHLGEHGMWHKMTLFEESARVPLLIYAPGMAQGKRCRGLVELIDLYPTLTDVCGLVAPDGLEGRSLVPQLRDPSKPARKAVYTSVNRHEDRSRQTNAFTYFGHSVRTERWRYTEWDEGRKGFELYDEANDPGEFVNLAGDPKYAAVKEELKRVLQPHTFRPDQIPATTR
jgi:iduronate 2-sulfatase